MFFPNFSLWFKSDPAFPAGIELVFESQFVHGKWSRRNKGRVSLC